ncbi:hypothetical protein CC78DRAFT_586231 [Lojkania enalia]|uniref:Uncharacterized protein n=1 Tax=Lojkania enalia TaxID=147567 RepID=A0A9P4K0G2_9PLEO|nr:hypothetical protein CC78DRAFT_586231 [Didymosphaeria enalia]
MSVRQMDPTFSGEFCWKPHPVRSKEKQLKACLDALLLTHPEVDRHGLLSTKGSRVPGACEYIEQDAAYTSWCPRIAILRESTEDRTNGIIYRHQNIFAKVVLDPSFGQTYCVLDGLGECEDQYSVLQSIRKLPGIPKFKLIIVGRDMDGLKNYMRIKFDPDNDKRGI